MQHDAALPLSHSQVGPDHLRPATSIYVVDVFQHTAPSEGGSGGGGGSNGGGGGGAGGGEEVPVLQLYHLDSGGGGMPEQLYTVSKIMHTSPPAQMCSCATPVCIFKLI